MNKTASIETLYCSLVYLMSRQAMAPQAHLPAIIADHLYWIAGHEDIERHPALRDTCRRLAPYWSGHRQHGDSPARFERHAAGGYGLN